MVRRGLEETERRAGVAEKTRRWLRSGVATFAVLAIIGPDGLAAAAQTVRTGTAARAVTAVRTATVEQTEPAEQTEWATRSAQVDDPFGDVRAMIREVMAERNLPSISVAAAKDGEVVWEEAFGWADREARVEATSHTMYSLASISKPVTATALMVLVERGEVDLDAPVDRFLGRVRLRSHGGDAEEATVRRVAAHTAGLPLHYQFFYEDRDYGPPPRAETIRRYGFVAHPPGTEFLYSNLGYGILDHVIAEASEREYADFLRTEVFLPLDMTRTSVGLPSALAPYAAVRYGPSDRPIPFYGFDHDGASAVWSSGHDLVRFGLFHLGYGAEGSGDVLTDASRRAMQLRETPEGGSGYGIGWFVADEYGQRKVWHTGSMPGVSTMLALYPELDVVVVVLLNGLARDLRVSISQEIVAALDEGYARAREEAREAASRAESGSSPGQDTAAEGGGQDGDRAHGFDPPPELVGNWSGTLTTWEGDLPMELVVDDDGDVHVDVAGQLITLLNDADFVDGRLQGRHGGRIPTADVMRHPLHSVFLNLRLEGDRLYGQASAQTAANPTFFSLASYVELMRSR